MSRLIPYVAAGGGSVGDSEILEFLSAAISEGVADTVFYAGVDHTPEKLLAVLKRSENLVTFVYQDGAIVGTAWLNGLSQGHAFGHFGFLSGSDAVGAGKQIIEYWSLFDAINVIVGMVPITNPKAIHYVKKLGFREAGQVPKMLKVEGKAVAGVILHRVCR